MGFQGTLADREKKHITRAIGDLRYSDFPIRNHGFEIKSGKTNPHQ